MKAYNNGRLMGTSSFYTPRSHEELHSSSNKQPYEHQQYNNMAPAQSPRHCYQQHHPYYVGGAYPKQHFSTPDIDMKSSPTLGPNPSEHVHAHNSYDHPPHGQDKKLGLPLLSPNNDTQKHEAMFHQNRSRQENLHVIYPESNHDYHRDQKYSEHYYNHKTSYPHHPINNNSNKRKVDLISHSKNEQENIQYFSPYHERSRYDAHHGTKYPDERSVYYHRHNSHPSEGSRYERMSNSGYYHDEPRSRMDRFNENPHKQYSSDIMEGQNYSGAYHAQYSSFPPMKRYHAENPPYHQNYEYGHQPYRFHEHHKHVPHAMEDKNRLKQEYTGGEQHTQHTKNMDEPKNNETTKQQVSATCNQNSIATVVSPQTPTTKTKETKPKRKKMYSDYVGVTYNKTHAKYQACITHYRKQHYLGRYKLAVDAARAYDNSARELKGKGWKTNFKSEDEYLAAKKIEEENQKKNGVAHFDEIRVNAEKIKKENEGCCCTSSSSSTAIVSPVQKVDKNNGISTKKKTKYESHSSSLTTPTQATKHSLNHATSTQSSTPLTPMKTTNKIEKNHSITRATNVGSNTKGSSKNSTQSGTKKPGVKDPSTPLPSVPVMPTSDLKGIGKQASVVGQSDICSKDNSNASSPTSVMHEAASALITLIGQR